MKPTYYFQCELCGHMLRSDFPTYKSPCPKCRGKMFHVVTIEEMTDKEELLSLFKVGGTI